MYTLSAAKLAALQVAYADRKPGKEIVEESADKRMTHEEWKNTGQPVLLHLEERDIELDISVYIDVAYGYLIAFKGDTLLGITLADTMVFEQAVIINVEYYSAKKYIWK